MTILSKICVRAFLAAIFATLCVTPIFADTKAPDPSANPVLETIVKTGAKLYYLGNQAGFDGWFIVKGSEVQVAYDVPGSQNAIIGALFAPDGTNISSDQIQALLSTNKELEGQFSSSMGGVAPQFEMQEQSPAAALKPVSPNVVASVLQPPGERLMTDLQKAAGVNLGSPSAPLLYMVMDPDCPHCQATWRLLRDAVMKNTLQLRMIPTGGQNPEHERAAAELLHVVDPQTAWDKYVNGDKSQLAGTPDPTLIGVVRNNSALADSWHLEMTPFLVYRAKDGTVKVVRGELSDASSVLNDIK